MKHEEYKRPLLASIYYVIGFLSLFGTVAAVGTVASASERLDSAIIILFLGAFGALILFAVGQVIELLGKTEHHSRVLTHEMVHMIRAQLEADELLKKIAGEEETEEEDDFKFGGVSP